MWRKQSAAQHRQPLGPARARHGREGALGRLHRRGHLGRAAIDHLLARGVAPSELIAAGRAVEKLDGLRERGVEVTGDVVRAPAPSGGARDEIRSAPISMSSRSTNMRRGIPIAGPISSARSASPRRSTSR